MSRARRRWFVLALVAAALNPAGVQATAGPADAAAGTRDTATGILDTQILRDDAGPIAYRQRDPESGWSLPASDAVLLEEAWWSPLRPLEPVTPPAIKPPADLLERIRGKRLTAWSVGDVTLDGEDELVVSFRRPFRRNFMNVTRPRRAWVDADGLSAHLGLYRPGDLDSIWVAGTLVSPVVALAACHGGLAVAYGELDRPGITETGAWRWVVFGFLPVEPLPGPGEPVCVDIDGDGLTEPAIIGRSEP